MYKGGNKLQFAELVSARVNAYELTVPKPSERILFTAKFASKRYTTVEKNAVLRRVRRTESVGIT